MKSFEYAAPKSLKEATELLGEKWGKSEVLAGGTDLLTSLKQGITAPDRLVSLKNIDELKGIALDNHGVTVRAMTTLGEMAAHAGVKEHFPSLITAIESIGSPQIIGTGTVGGDLCQRPRCWYFRNGHGLFGKDGDTSLVREGDNRYHAIFGNDGAALFVSASSLGPALVALGASISVIGPRGARTIAAAQFFHTPSGEDDRETALKPNEILKEVHISILGLNNAAYEVRHRYGLDWPYVTATVAFQVKAGVASDARLVLGHVAPVPWPVANAAKVLNGAEIKEPLAAKCGEAATQGAKPLSRNAYKIQMVKTAVKRAVMAAKG